MAAYPMMYFPTWREMKEQLVKDYGVEICNLNVDTPAGPHQIVYLKRKHKGKEICHPVPMIFDEEERLSIPVIRNICEGLNVPKADFGLTLG
jgi:hypothetical protein